MEERRSTGKTPFERAMEQHPLTEDGLPHPFEIGIPMRDRVELAASVYLPADTEQPVPVIVEITPYDKSGAATQATLYQRHGYGFVAVDCRGRGKSEGEWRAFFNDPNDGHDTIEWVAAQAWCNGKVGTTGLSYMGWTQWAAASESPPHLVCMISNSAAGRWQQEIPYTNGCFQLYFGWWVFAVRRRIAERYATEHVDWDEVLRRLPLDAIGDFIAPSGPTWREMMDHDRLDEFWNALRFDGHYNRITVPCLHVTGWYDLEDLLGAFHHYEHMIAESPAREQQQLIVGPWSHVGTRHPSAEYGGVEFGPQAAIEMDDVHLRWFDYWLKGIQNGAVDDPRVRIFEPGTNAWIETDRWPLASTEETLYLRFDGREGTLAATPPEGSEPPQSYRYDPEDPAPTQLDVLQYPLENPPLDQSAVEARSDVISYTSDPLTETLVISGWPHLDLNASSDGDDTEWHVKLTDVTPDGRSLKVSQGCLRASYRNSLAASTPLTPGEITHFDVELWPAHHAFLPGHRVRITITSSDFPWFARSMNQFGPLKSLHEPRVALNSIHHGVTTPSRVRLPVVGSGSVDDGHGDNATESRNP